VRRRVGQGGVENIVGRADPGEQAPGDDRVVRLAAERVQFTSDRRVPEVQQIAVTASQQRPDPHQRPTVGPVPLPGMLLALDAVDLLEAEEPPVDGDSGLLADVAYPQRRLVRERAHRIEMEVHAGPHLSRIAWVRL